MLLFFICWIPKYGSKFDKIENEYTKARGIFYDLSDFASGRCRKPGPEPTERRKQKNYSEPLSEYVYIRLGPSSTQKSRRPSPRRSTRQPTGRPTPCSRPSTKPGPERSSSRRWRLPLRRDRRLSRGPSYRRSSTAQRKPKSYS